MTPEEVVALMESSTSLLEWNDNERKVKAHFGGEKPDFWWEFITKSGVAKRTVEKIAAGK